MDLKQALKLLIEEAPKHFSGIITYQLSPLLDRDLDDITRAEVWEVTKDFQRRLLKVRQAVKTINDALQTGTLKIDENLSTDDKG